MTFDYFANPPPGIDLTESRTASDNAIVIVLFVLSLLFVGLRLLTRLFLKREALCLDDYLMFLGLALNAGNLACCIVGGCFGLGKHIWSLGPYNMRQITIITFAYIFIHVWSICMIKFSILALYRRIFGMTRLGWFWVAITAGSLITNQIVLPLHTRPLHYYWNQWYGDEGVVLVNEAKFYLGVGIINLLGDICILAIPIGSVLKLNMRRLQKVAVSLTFLLGIFVCFASLYRIITITRLVQTKDVSWAKSDVFIWSSIEPSVGIICGCLPTLCPVMLQVTDALSRILPSTPNGSRHTESPTQPLDLLEMSSKKRMRKIKVNDTLDSTTITQSEIRNERKSWIKSRNDHELWGRSRLDEDEIGLTTTTVHGECPNAGRNVSSDMQTTELSQIDRREQGITLTREFEWGEGKQSPIPRK